MEFTCLYEFRGNTGREFGCKMMYAVALDPEVEQFVVRKAISLGISPSDYLARLAEIDAAKTEPETSTAQPFGDCWRTAFGNKPAGTGKFSWPEVEAACDSH